MIDIRDCNVYSVLVCPGCGSEDAGIHHAGNKAMCPECNMHFVLLRQTKSTKSDIKIVYASKQKGFTFSNYHWKVCFITHSIPPAWRARGMIRNNKKKMKISKRMAGLWEAHQVAVALKGRRVA